MRSGRELLSKATLEKVAPFRFDRLGERYLITNDVGEYALLSADEFSQLVSGTLPDGTEKHGELKKKHFLHSDEDETALARAYARKNAFLFNGPWLHIIIVTLRCNEVCVYCHASRRGMEERSADMSIDLARTVVDTIFQSPSETLNIEFQGGEPLANWEVVKFILDYAVEKNRTAGKRVEFSLVTNLSLMDEEKLAVLMQHNVQICTSVDGPKPVHEANRHLLGGSSYEAAVTWMRRADHAYKEKGLDPDLYHVEALLTVTRDTLTHPKEVVDEYVRLGRKAVFLRPQIGRAHV